jgi:hypothetical protein
MSCIPIKIQGDFDIYLPEKSKPGKSFKEDMPQLSYSSVTTLSHLKKERSVLPLF